jgi:hypothetical protein
LFYLLVPFGSSFKHFGPQPHRACDGAGLSTVVDNERPLSFIPDGAVKHRFRQVGLGE